MLLDNGKFQVSSCGKETSPENFQQSNHLLLCLNTAKASTLSLFLSHAMSKKKKQQHKQTKKHTHKVVISSIYLERQILWINLPKA